jgi:potassium-transporting ATPase KdpC subunit
MLKQILPALRATIVLAALTGLVFPILITIIAQFLFPKQANGSLISNKEGEIIGSELIGQQFAKPQYFHPRPSAAGAGYSSEASSGTNLGPTSSKLIIGQTDNPKTNDVDEFYAGIKQLAQQYTTENYLSKDERTPVDAVTRSGSGLDPHISKTNALFQARRVAKIRSVSLEKIMDLIHKHTEERQFGIFGEPRINVLKLNLALEENIQ